MWSRAAFAACPAFRVVAKPVLIGGPFQCNRSLAVNSYVSICRSFRPIQPCMTSSSPGGETQTEEDEEQAADALVRRASSVAADLGADVAARPTFYLSGAGYAGASVLALLIAMAIVRTIDGVPILPSFLKLVGVTYSGFFVYRYLLYEESRAELQRNIGDFLDQVR